MESPDTRLDELFDEDYVHFNLELFTDSVSDRDALALWNLLNLEPGQRVLDLGCGHGRLSNRLAAAGCLVTAVDGSEAALTHAAVQAELLGVYVEYVQADFRDLEIEEEYDRAYLWYTTFGTLADQELRELLRRLWHSLKPGGELLIDTMNLAKLEPSHTEFRTAEGVLTDSTFLNLDSQRMVVDRVIERGGRRRAFRFETRLFKPAELEQWFKEAGFQDVRARDLDGSPFTPESRRLIVTGRRQH